MQIYPIDNILRSPTAYEMDPLMQIKAMMAMETQGETLAAIYHSHPDSPPFPSETDITQAYYPEAVYIIVSLKNYDHPVIKGFTIIAGVVNEANIRIEQPSIDTWVL